MSVKDSLTFTLNEADLTGKKVGECLETPERDVPCSDGLQWWIEYFPAGDYDDATGFVSVYLWTNKPVKANYVVVIDGSISVTDTHEFADAPQGSGWPNYAPHKQLRPLFRDGKLTITCNAEFISSIQSIPVAPAVNEIVDYATPDFDLVVGSKRIPVHKNYLSLISPVFCDMFENGEEKEEMVITGVDYYVVKIAIDYCYGRELKLLSAETYVDVLRFADNMEIKIITENWEKLIPLNLSAATFCDFLQYAYDFKKYALLIECSECLKTNQNEIKVAKKFVNLSPTIVIEILVAAFDLKSDDQVARHAHIHGIHFVRDYLEKRLRNDLSIENFSIAASYAWEFSRKSLQKACAKFFNDKQIMIIRDEGFLNLPAKTIRNVLKLSAKKNRLQGYSRRRCSSNDVSRWLSRNYGIKKAPTATKSWRNERSDCSQ